MSEFASGTLSAKNIHLSFGSNHVLRGIDLHVPQVHPAAGHEPAD